VPELEGQVRARTSQGRQRVSLCKKKIKTKEKMDIVLLLHLMRPLFASESKEKHLRKIHQSSTYTTLAILYLNTLAHFHRSLAAILTIKMCFILFVFPLFVAAQVSLFNRRRRAALMFLKNDNERGLLKERVPLHASVEALWRAVQENI
jgi:hypothetical protein